MKSDNSQPLFHASFVARAVNCLPEFEGRPSSWHSPKCATETKIALGNVATMTKVVAENTDLARQTLAWSCFLSMSLRAFGQEVGVSGSRTN